MKNFYRICIGMMLTLVATMAAAQSEYRVRAGDTLVIEVLEDPTLNRSVVVLPDGRFSFPMAGTIPAAGRNIGQIREAVTQAISSSFAATPNVYVGVQPAPPTPRVPRAPAPAPMITVYLMGEVEKSGPISVPPGTTFLQALSQSGGITPFGATKRVQLRRTNPTTRAQKVYRINYRALSNGAALSRDIVLTEGDVILVPERRLFE